MNHKNSKPDLPVRRTQTGIRISLAGANQPLVSFRYNPIFVEKIKAIAGRRWHPEKKHWSFPNNNGKLARILEIFRDEKIHIDPALKVNKNPSPKTHLYYNKDFLNISGKSPSEITDNDIKDYLVYLAEEKRSATSTLNLAINALKFCYGIVLKKKFVYEVRRPRKDRKLPVVLSKEEVAKILSSVDNVKHKAILMLVYSSGLRVGEVIKLKPADIDSKRMLVFIKGAKGRKDRYSLLSESALKTLREYWKQYKPANWLFSAPDKERHITVRTAQRVFDSVCEKAKIQKDVTIHSLRHSFATHLLESGTDLWYTPHFIEHYHNSATI